MKKYVFLSGIIILLSFSAYGAAMFGGVGIDGAPLRNGEILVKQLVTGGPAYLAGIRKGDIIVSIDDMPAKGSNFGEMVQKRLRGRVGTKVRMSIRRPGREKLLQFTLVRRELILRGR